MEKESKFNSKDLRRFLPKIYEGNRRVGKTTKLIELFKRSMKQGNNAYIVVFNSSMKDFISENWKIPKDRVVSSAHQIEKASSGSQKKSWFADEWWLLKRDVRTNLIHKSWCGDEVIGFGTNDEHIMVKQFDQHFKVNPNLKVDEINELLVMLLGKRGLR